jgi:hypothetical protein
VSRNRTHRVRWLVVCQQPLHVWQQLVQERHVLAVAQQRRRLLQRAVQLRAPHLAGHGGA